MMRKEGAVPSAPVQAVPEAAVSSASQSSPVNPTVEPTAIPQPPVGGPPASPASGLALNERYIIENELGRGGMSRVFVARDTKLGRKVAIKFLAPGIHDDDELRRFEQEARAAGSLNHPNVLTVHDIGMHEGNPYIVSELLEGGTLRQHLEGMPFALSRAVDYAEQLADGLAAAHERGIIHRDLKPENLFITHDGRLKILDFGIAKLVAPESESAGLKQPAQTQTGAILGTMGYMSPEQVRGQHADCRSDIFSAGAILYEMLSGKRAFKAGSLVETAYAILNDNPPELPEQVPVNLQEVVWRCLEKKPEERFQSARELAFQLQKVSESPGSGSETHSPRVARKLTPQVAEPVARRWHLRWPFAVAGALALLVALLLAPSVGRWRERLLGSTKPANEGAGPPAALIKIRRSVAVLGFKNLSGRPEEAWLSTALSEMLTTELAAGGKLRTIPGENVGRMKTELALADAETLAKETLVRVRKNLLADLVVLGSYVHLGKEAGSQMRMDVRLQDAVAGETIDAFAETGTEKNLFDLVSRAGAKLRKKLGIGETSKAEAAEVRASLPGAPDAARLYSEGLAKLRVFDAVGARELLEKAVAADPNHALARSALSAAWSVLDYGEKAKDEAKKAFDLSANLSREDRLGVEGRYRETTREWGKAIENYRTLWDFFPDNVDYGFRLAEAQISSSKGKDALATVEALSKLPSPGRDDPRIDIAEAHAAYSLAEYKRAQEAAARAAAKGEAREAKILVAKARLSEGAALAKLGEPQRARAAYDEAQRFYAAAGDQAGVAGAFNNIANLQINQRDLVGAKGALEQALVVFREVGNRPAEAMVLSNIAFLLNDQGDLDGAKRMHEKALAMKRELGDKGGMAKSLLLIGVVLFREGNLASAKGKWEESLAIVREIGDRESISIAQRNLAVVLMEQGDLAGARETFQQVLASGREMGDKRSVAFSLLALGEVLGMQGDLASARKNEEEGLAIRKQLGEKGNIAHSERFLASLAIEEGRPSEAELLARKAVEELQTEHAADGEAEARVVLARSLLAQGQAGRAQEVAGRAVELAGKSQNRRVRLLVDIISAQIRASLHKQAEAKKSLKSTLAEATKYGFVGYQLEARLALGEIEMKSGESAAGRVRLKALEKDATAKQFAVIARKAAAARR